MAHYEGRLPADFRERGLLQANVAGLEHVFATPRHAVRRIVGVAATSTAPARWEVELGLVPPPADRELDRLYMAAEMHGTGLGAALLDAVVDERPLYLWLIDGNDRAARFYERRGFRHLEEEISTGPTLRGPLVERSALG